MTQLVGGSLAASTAAALGGRLGLAGTLIGAAAASVVSAVAAAVYTHSLRRTREFIRTTRVVPDPLHDATDPAEPPLEVMAPAAPRTLRLDLGGLRMRRLGTGALAVFAAAAIVVTGVELATGRSLDGDRGTTAAQVVSGSGRSVAEVPAVTATTATGASTTATTASPSPSAPTVTATVTVTTAPTAVSTTGPSATSSPTAPVTTAPATP